MGNYFSRKMKVISSILIAALFIGMLPWRELAADSNTHGEYDAYPFDITYEQNSTWNNSTQGQFTITNTSDHAVKSWRLEIIYGSDVTITNIWDATDVTDYNNDEHIIVSGNIKINAGGTYTFGLIAEGEDLAPVAPIDVNTVQFISDEPTPTPTPEPTATPVPTATNTPTPTDQPTVTNTPTHTPTDVEEEIVFPYAIFAASTSHDFTFQGWKSNITGDIYSGRNFLYQGSELTLEGYARTVGTIQPSGWKTDMTGFQEHVTPIEIPDWSASILAKEDDMPAIDPTAFGSQESVVANGYYYTDGDLTISSTDFTGDAVIVAKGNITYNVDVLNNNEEFEGRVLLYSEEGNITLNGTEIDINGILYAPQGRVSINAYNTTINGRIVADKFSYSGSILNVTADPSDLQLVSELPDVTVTANKKNVSIGQTAYYTIDIPEDNVYEILYRLNGTNVMVTMPDNEEDPIRYTLDTSEAGIYTLEAYVSLPYGTFVLDSDTITVAAQPTATPTNTPTPTTTSTPTSTPVPTAINTPTPTNTPTPMATPVPTATNTPTPVPTATNMPTPTLEPTAIPTETPMPTPFPTEEPTVTPEPTATPTPTPTGIPDYSMDSDEDYLPDAYELEIGTDPNNPDSDFDDIPDGIEIAIGYDPNEPDSDGNLIEDGDEDFDGDGLSNRDELTRGTVISQPDSDYDDLEDGEEVNTYHTDPTNKDSDGDKIYDGDEVALGKDPNDPSDGKTRISQTLRETIRNDEDSFVTKIDVTTSVANKINRVLTIEDLYDQDVYTTALVGRKGSPVGLECEETFSTATIVFHYDDSKLGSTREDDLGVLWYDEEHGLYITQEQAVIDKAKNTIALEVTHFSTYVIADLEVWNNIEPVHYDIPTKEKTFDYILVFDKSTAVSADQRFQACELAFDLLGHMKQGDRLTYGFFTQDYNVTLQGQCSDYAGRNDLLDDLNWNLTRGQLPGTYGSYEQALKVGKALSEQLISSLGESDNEKQLLIITSDKDEGYRPGIYMQEMPEDGYGGISVITLEYRDQSQSNAHGNHFANFVGGDFYNYDSYGDSIWDEFSSKHCGRTEDWSDLDKDGVADFMEEQGLLLSNGQIITTKTNPLAGDDGYAIGYDSDEDTLSDGEELGTIQIYHYVKENGKRTITCTIDGVESNYHAGRFSWKTRGDEGIYYVFDYNSDPTSENTDGDDYYDCEDGFPKRPNPNMIYLVCDSSHEGECNLMRDYYRSQFNSTVRVACIDTYADLLFEWNGIGQKNDYYKTGGLASSTKYYYNPQAVVLDFHGDVGMIIIPNGNNAQYIMVSDLFSSLPPKSSFYNLGELKNKKIQNLHIFTCYSAIENDCYSSVAVDLIKNNTVSRTFAYDGEAAFYADSQRIPYFCYSEKNTSTLGLVEYVGNSDNRDAYSNDLMESYVSINGEVYVSFEILTHSLLSTDTFDPIVDFVLSKE